jgi:hypothetical protein
MYEKAMLEEAGASELLAKKPRPTQPPLLTAPGPVAQVAQNFGQW